MTVRQKVLKAIYPVVMWWRGNSTKKEPVLSNSRAVPAVSFYSLKDTAITGTEFDFSQLKGKKVLLVNTASDCGYTNQYESLEALFRQNTDNLVVIGFPSNDFKQQEKGTDEEIAVFCKKNFDVSFPLMKKSHVRKGGMQNKIFSWLTDSAKNGWNNKQPSWNFAKYLVNENGVLTHYFDPAVPPSGDEIIKAIKQ